MANQPRQRWSMRILVACVISYLAALCVLIGFASPHWIVKNPNSPNKFINMGLWEFCFNHFSHPDLAYKRVFTGCRWVFHRYYDVLLDFLEPAWFISVQVMMSIGLLSLVIALGFTVIVILNMCLKKLTRNLLIITLLMATTFFFHFLSVIIFGVRGDDRDWLPSPQWNRFGYSYGFAVVGTFLEFISCLLFFLEFKLVSRNKPKQQRQQYPAHQPEAFHIGQYRYPQQGRTQV